jgi:hypothetical protein
VVDDVDVEQDLALFELQALASRERKSAEPSSGSAGRVPVVAGPDDRGGLRRGQS